MTIATRPLTDATRTEIQQTFQRQQAYAPSLARSTYQERDARLKKLEDFVADDANQQRLIEAIANDFSKPATESVLSEIGVVLQHLRYVRRHLRRWMRPEAVATPLVLTGTQSYVHFEPKGVCLIISPWNYPFNLVLVPLTYALAAGNTVLLKPSEMSPHTTSYIRQMMADLFDPQEVAVFEGGVDVSTALLEQPVNHIFFTGSPAVGKIVMRAASEHLASVTLELGGKSPTIIGPSANVKALAGPTTWGKCFNAGQTCIAPDYVLVPEDKLEEYIGETEKNLRAFYDADGKGVAASKDFARIINDRHFERLQRLLDDAVAKGAKVVIGGTTNAAERYVEPTFLTQVTEDMAIMQEEIFGPLMPILTYRDKSELPTIIGRRPKPLCLYINSKDMDFIRYVMEHTSAGGTVINDYLLGYSNPNLPFGGINNSGIGKSLGHQGFREFSNERGVIHRRFLPADFLYPPYTKRVGWIAKLLARWM